MAAEAISAIAKTTVPSSLAETGLSKAERDSAESYWIHPAVLDSTLHVGAYLGVSQGAAVKVPVGLASFAIMTRFGGSSRQDSSHTCAQSESCQVCEIKYSGFARSCNICKRLMHLI